MDGFLQYIHIGVTLVNTVQRSTLSTPMVVMVGEGKRRREKKNHISDSFSQLQLVTRTDNRNSDSRSPYDEQMTNGRSWMDLGLAKKAVFPHAGRSRCRNAAVGLKETFRDGRSLFRKAKEDSK